MSKYIFPTLVFLLIAYFIGKQVISQKNRTNMKAPDFNAVLINGDQMTLSSLQGNYVLLDFWGSWCAPCLRDLPKLIALNEKYKSQSFKNADKFILVSVALEKDDKRWKAVSERYDFNWHHQIVQIHNFIMLSPIARKFGVTEIPAKFLIDPNGKIVAKNDLATFDKILEEQLR